MQDDQPVDAPRPETRRKVLAAAAAGAAAWVATAVGGPPAAEASATYVALGSDLNISSATTKISVPTAGYSAFWGHATSTTGVSVGVRGDSSADASTAAGVLGIAPSAIGVRGVGFIGVRGEGTAQGVRGLATGGGDAVVGSAESGRGVVGSSTSGPGVLGTSVQQVGVVGWQFNGGTGVIGCSPGPGAPPPAAKPKTGVYGESKVDGSSRGVWGASGTGEGVRGEATTGVAVAGVASAAGGYAIRSSGRVRFDKVCGIATLAAGTTSKVISPGTDVTADSFVLLTPGADIGSRRLWFTKDTTANTITIRMSSGMASTTSISWLLLR